MTPLTTILFRRFKEAKLANFYIIKTANHNQQSATLLKECVDNFIGQVLIDLGLAETTERALQKIKLGHPDILNVAPSDEQKNYVQEDFVDFFRFQNFKAMELPHRFVVVNDSHKINTLISNKLLKTLEEPQEQTTIFFLVPKGHLHLPTIQSRAISLTLRDQQIQEHSHRFPFDDHPELNPTLNQLLRGYFFEEGSIQEIMTQIKSDRPLQDQLCSHLIEAQQIIQSSYSNKKEVLEALRRYQTAKVFHNPPLERLYCLLEATKRSLQNC